MKSHQISKGRGSRHGNKMWPHKPNPNADIPTVRKIPVSTVTYGDSLTHRPYLWGAFNGEELIAYAATAPEVRTKYRVEMAHRRERAYQTT
jgi:hypothetical protein